MSRKGQWPRAEALRVLADRLPVDSRSVSPQPFEVVELPRYRLEHVNDHVAVVEQHPFSLGDSLHSNWITVVFFLDPVVDFIGQSTNMAIGGAGGDHEDLGDLQQLGDVEEHDFEAFFVIQNVGDEACGLVTFLDELAPVPCEVVADDDSYIEDR